MPRDHAQPKPDRVGGPACGIAASCATLGMFLGSGLLLLLHLLVGFGWPAQPKLHLQPTVTPLSYDLDLTLFAVLRSDLDFGKHNNTIHGLVQIRLRPVRNTSIILINVQQITITDVIRVRNVESTKDGADSEMEDVNAFALGSMSEQDGRNEDAAGPENAGPAEEISVLGLKHFPDNHQLAIMLDNDLITSNIYTLAIRFQGKIAVNPSSSQKSKLSGVYTMATDQTTNSSKVLATQFQFFEASKAFPCFDDPALKARFRIQLTYPDGFTALSNMPAVETYQLSKEMKHTEFALTPMMSTYLLAFYVGDYGSVEDTVLGLPVRFFARNDTIDRVAPSRRLASRALHFFADYFKSPFPLPKLDFVVVAKSRVNGMENWGLVMLRDTDVLLEFGLGDDDRFIMRSAELIVHEICHQWFGNLVSPKWWDDYWFFEGMTAFLTHQAISYALDDAQASDYLHFRDRYITFELDEAPRSSLRTWVDKPVSHHMLNSALFYKKGFVVLDMLNKVVGSNLMQDTVAQFVKDRAYGSATSNDFFALLDRTLMKNKHWLPESGQSSTDFINEWTSIPGLPVVHVKRFNATHSLFTQSPYDPLRTNVQRTKRLQWNVPLVLNADSTVVLLKKGESTLLNHSILDFSLPYLIRYDQATFHEVLGQVQLMSSDQRVHLLINVYHLAFENRLPVNFALKAMTALLDAHCRRSQFIYQLAALDMLSVFHQHPRRNALEQYLFAPLEDAFNKIVVNYTEPVTINDQHIAEMLMVFMCEARYKPCEDLAYRYFEEFKHTCNRDKTPKCVKVPIPLRRGFFNTIISHGVHQEVAMLSDMRHSKTDTQKIIMGLSYTPYREDLIVEDLYGPIIPVMNKGKEALKNGVSVHAIDFANDYIVYNAPLMNNTLHSPDIDKFYKVLEFASLYPSSSLAWYLENFDCDCYFAHLHNANYLCRVLSARFYVRRDILQANQDVLTAFLDNNNSTHSGF